MEIITAEIQYIETVKDDPQKQSVSCPHLETVYECVRSFNESPPRDDRLRVRLLVLFLRPFELPLRLEVVTGAVGEPGSPSAANGLWMKNLSSESRPET